MKVYARNNFKSPFCYLELKMQVLKAYFSSIHERIAKATEAKSELLDAAKTIMAAADAISNFIQEVNQKHEQFLEVAARDFSYSLARTFMGTALTEISLYKILLCLLY